MFILICQLVENVAICLIKIVERVSQSSEMLDDLCKHGLIQQTINLLNSNGRTAKSLSVNNVCFSILLMFFVCLIHMMLTVRVIFTMLLCLAGSSRNAC